MNIHEYQAKEILRRFGVPVPEGAVAFTREEAEKIAHSLTADVFAVKSQIHAGGRGKAGGIKVVKTPEEVLKAARELIGKVLVTPQTGPRGKEVRKVLVEAGSVPKREFYLGILIDRTIARPSFLASTEGKTSRLSNSCGFGGVAPAGRIDKSSNIFTLTTASSGATRPDRTADKPALLAILNNSCCLGLRKSASTNSVRSPNCEKTTARLAAI